MQFSFARSNVWDSCPKFVLTTKCRCYIQELVGMVWGPDQSSIILVTKRVGTGGLGFIMCTDWHLPSRESSSSPPTPPFMYAQLPKFWGKQRIFILCTMAIRQIHQIFLRTSNLMFLLKFDSISLEQEQVWLIQVPFWSQTWHAQKFSIGFPKSCHIKICLLLFYLVMLLNHFFLHHLGSPFFIHVSSFQLPFQLSQLNTKWRLPAWIIICFTIQGL